MRELPEALRATRCRTRKRGAAAAASTRSTRHAVRAVTAPTMLRLRLAATRHATAIAELDRQDREAAARAAPTSPSEPGRRSTSCAASPPRAAAELLVEVGDVRRFSEASFARFNGTAPLPASSARAPDNPSATGSTAAGTEGSTPSSTAWP